MYRLNQIVHELEKCESCKIYQFATRKEKFINALSGKLIAFSCVSFFLLLLLAFWYWLHPQSTMHLWPALVLYMLCTLSATIALFLPTGMGLWHIFSWRKRAMPELSYEMGHDEANAERLSLYTRQELEYAQYWFQLKINRLLVRVSNVFGDKTALVALIGLSYAVVKSLGGPGNLFAMFNKGLTSAEGIIALGLALLLGISLGALMLKGMANWYAYKLEIIQLAMKIQELKTEETPRS